MTVPERARRARRARILSTMIETAARSVGWHASAEDRITTALLAHQVTVVLPEIELRAWVTAELALAISVVRALSWDADVEARLRDALERSAALVAGLLLEEWEVVRTACIERVDRDLDAESGQQSAGPPPAFARGELESAPEFDVA
jgi:hypothetical protein